MIREADTYPAKSPQPGSGWRSLSVTALGRSRVVICLGILLFPALLLLLATYYHESMAAYISPLSTPDEFGYISVAAFLNGHNWVAVARGIPWYSYGYSLLLAPLFSLTAATHWYRDAQWLNIALIVALGVCANLFLRKIDRTSRPWLRHLVVAVILLYPSLVFYARLAWAETLIAVMPWLLGLLIYRSFEKPGRYVDAFLCGCLLMASYYIHARLIVLVAAGLVVFLFMSFRAGRWRELSLAVLGMTVVLVPAYWFKDVLLAQLYGGAVRGAQDSPLKMLIYVWHLMGGAAVWRNLIGSAAGQFAYLVIATLGLLIAGGAAIWQQLRLNYRQREWANFAALVFIVLGPAGCYLLVLMTMGLSPQLPHHVFYGRYTEPLVLPIIAMGLLYLCRRPSRAVLYMAVALAFACALVPIGIHVARQLHDQSTYWTLITGLFTYKTPDWRLATKTILLGFFVVTVLASLAFRIHRYAGLALVAVLFLCADYGLVQTYASATHSHSLRWQARPLPGDGGLQPRTVKLDMLDGDPYMLRARVQVINAASRVIPARQWPEDFSGTYEQLTWDGKRVKRAVCTASPQERDVCTPLEDSAHKATHLSIQAGKLLRVGHAILPHRLYRIVASVPYLNAVWPEVAMRHTFVRFDVAGPHPQGLTIKVFVTKPGQGKWLVDKRLFQPVEAEQTEGEIRVPIPVRTYSGVALPKGDYVFHAVVIGLRGNEWSTMASVPMQIN